MNMTLDLDALLASLQRKYARFVGKRIAIAMSGGVDSSVSALLLQKAGFDVIGITLKLWNCLETETITGDTKKLCCTPEHVNGSQKMANDLGFPYYVINVEKEFEQEVISPFVASYLKGETPIPCTHCNDKLKFDYLLKRAIMLGCDAIATGHYTKIEQVPSTGRYYLAQPREQSKDQSYFLFSLRQKVLERCVFPLEDLTKPEVREIARHFGIPAAGFHESQNICFLPNNDYGNFVKKRMGTDIGPGNLIDIASGKVVGQHNGYYQFTVGQRRGLSIAMGEPYYVIKTVPDRNEVYIGKEEHLMQRELRSSSVSFMKEVDFDAKTYYAKIRYGSKPQPCAAQFDTAKGLATITFHEPQRGITPGQAVVIYDEANDLVAGAWIQ